MSKQGNDIDAMRLKSQKKKLMNIAVKSIPKSIMEEARQSLRKMSKMTFDEVNEKLKHARIKLIMRRKMIRECEDRIQVYRHGKTLKRTIAIIHLLNDELKRRDVEFDVYDLTCDENFEIKEENGSEVERNRSFEEDVLLSLDTESLEDILLDRFTEELEDRDDEDSKLSPEEQHDMIHYQKFEQNDDSEQSFDDVQCRNCVECGREVVIFEEEDELMCGRCFEDFFTNEVDIDDIEIGDDLLDVFPIQPIPAIPFDPTFPTIIQPEPIIDIPEEFLDKPLYFYPSCSLCDLNIYEDSLLPGFCVWCYYAIMSDDAEYFDVYDEDFLLMDM